MNLKYVQQIYYCLKLFVQMNKFLRKLSILLSNIKFLNHCRIQTNRYINVIIFLKSLSIFVANSKLKYLQKLQMLLLEANNRNAQIQSMDQEAFLKTIHFKNFVSKVNFHKSSMLEINQLVKKIPLRRCTTFDSVTPRMT